VKVANKLYAKLNISFEAKDMFSFAYSFFAIFTRQLDAVFHYGKSISTYVLGICKVRCVFQCDGVMMPMGACSRNRGINVQGIKYKGIGSRVRNKLEYVREMKRMYFNIHT